jgi:uncharacterized 2Fe-2S/4Fe-4S cluster protein (DUF4445 family)
MPRGLREYGKLVREEIVTRAVAEATAERFGIKLCGGNGVCGKCRVKVADGHVYADKHSISMLSKEEILYLYDGEDF